MCGPNVYSPYSVNERRIHKIINPSDKAFFKNYQILMIIIVIKAINTFAIIVVKRLNEGIQSDIYLSKDITRNKIKIEFII